MQEYEYQSTFLTIEYNERESYQINTWLPSTEQLDDEGFKREVSQQTIVALRFKCKAFITDAKEFLFLLHPKLQDWVSEHIFRDMREAGVKKLALIVSSDIIAQMGIEQLVDDDLVKGFTTGYFDNIDAAKVWILEKENHFVTA